MSTLNTPLLDKDEATANEVAAEVTGVSLQAQSETSSTQSPVIQSSSTRSSVVTAAVPRFAAFSHRNFRLFWIGNLLSLIGTWAQQTGQGWLMRTLTPDPFLIAGVAACGSLPILFLTLYTGAVADRVDKRRTLFITNVCALLLALVMGLLVWSDVVQVWHIALLSLLLGTINAFDIPVRQSFNLEMVGRRDLPNAIALNSSAFNAARVIGPASGGWMLQQFGIAGCFLVNAFSFVALLIGLAKMRFRPCAPSDSVANSETSTANDSTANDSTANNNASSTRTMTIEAEEPCLPDVEHSRRGSLSRDDILQGFYFVRDHETLRPVVLLVAMVSLFAMSFSTLLPVFARDVFLTDEAGYSRLMTFNGVGAMCSAFALAIVGTMRHKGKRLLLGALLFCVSVGLFAAAPDLVWACGALVLAGWFLLTFLTTANTLVQTIAPDELRGRVFSLYSLALIGTNPLGAAFVGLSAKYFGPRVAVGLGASIASLICIGLFANCRRLWKER